VPLDVSPKKDEPRGIPLSVLEQFNDSRDAILGAVREAPEGIPLEEGIRFLN